MTLAQTMRMHGHSIQVEYPERGTIEYKGFSAKYKGNAAKPNWLHFAIPTPVNINDKPCLESVSLRLRGGGGAYLESIHVYDGEKKIAGEDNIHFRPTEWDIRKVDLPPGQKIQWSLGISVLVNFGIDDRWIEFSAASADFFSSGYSDNVINVRQFGAKGDGRTNDTKAIQSAVDFAATHSGIVFVPEGTYMIDAVKSINLPSNCIFQLSPRATLKAIPNDSRSYSVVKIYNSQNVTVTGGTIQGERFEHTDKGGEWGMGVDIRSSMNVTIRDVIAKDCWGDGFYIGKKTTSKNQSYNIKLQNCIADNNRRQGCSITSLIGGLIDGCVFSNTNGTNPEDGIDIEPNDKKDDGSPGIVRDINISCCIFSGNMGRGVTLSGSKPRVEVSSCILSGNICQNNKESGIGIFSAKEIVVVNNLCHNNKESGIGIHAAKEIVIANNLCQSNKKDGIKILSYQEPAKEIVIANNLCQSNKEDGIEINTKYNTKRAQYYKAKSTDINTVNNLCTDNGRANIKVNRSWRCGIQGNTCRGLATSSYGVYVDKTSSNTFVCNNDLLNSAKRSSDNFVNLSQSTVMVNNRVS